MKKLLFILAFVLISLTGFSQTFTSSSNTPGTTQNTYTVSIPQGNGYTYSYSITATNSTDYIIAYSKGQLGMLSNTSANQQQRSGSGSVGGSGSSKQYQDTILFIIANGASYCYGYAQISVNPY
jgi:hypothetical protein